MSASTLRVSGLRAFDWRVLLGCLLMFTQVAMAHEGHEKPETRLVTPAPSTGTHDAQTYFTDTLVKDQHGNELRFYSDVLKNKVVLLNVIFTHCTDACPLITRKLKEVRDALGEPLASQVVFITLSSDPQRDTPATLKAFAAKQGADDPNWLFLTGDKANMDLVLGRLGHLIPSPEQHSTQLIVGDVAHKRWSKVRPDAPAEAIAERLKLLSQPLAGR
ncbi:SCO family protein [Pseudomonas sp. R5(2019)]|uniref:SCO family protein n=1 Tax=Pseudomonas sp. R5(2019) TaxID=2697566 RepID=UPI00141308F8|nr:SCO family protein [Pseudomonas sp. R5(2019)]NBA96740.1 redoxin domain-containing protein [Pseudomonas sp. R5(2019)]